MSGPAFASSPVCPRGRTELLDQTIRRVHNRARKLDRVRTGTAHAALVFDGEDCVGWCQFGAPDEVARIKSRAAYEKIWCSPAMADRVLLRRQGARRVTHLRTLGFTRDRKIGKHRWFLTIEVEPRS